MERCQRQRLANCAERARIAGKMHHYGVLTRTQPVTFRHSDGYRFHARIAGPLAGIHKRGDGRGPGRLETLRAILTALYLYSRVFPPP
jgi:hypothetical protein